MKRKTPFLIAGLMLLFYGCDTYIMVSLNPFYIEKQVIMDSRFEGSWKASIISPSKDKISDQNENGPSTYKWLQADTVSAWVINKSTTTRDAERDGKINIPEKYYIAQLTGISDNTYKFKVVLFQIKNFIYADFIPFGKEHLLKSALTANGFFEVHTLARLSIQDNQMQFQWLDADCIKQMIEQKRVRLKYRKVNNEDKFILTSSSADLTTMIEHYGDQSRFIDWEFQSAQMKLNRVN